MSGEGARHAEELGHIGSGLAHARQMDSVLTACSDGCDVGGSGGQLSKPHERRNLSASNIKKMDEEHER